MSISTSSVFVVFPLSSSFPVVDLVLGMGIQRRHNISVNDMLGRCPYYVEVLAC